MKNSTHKIILSEDEIKVIQRALTYYQHALANEQKDESEWLNACGLENYFKRLAK